MAVRDQDSRWKISVSPVNRIYLRGSVDEPYLEGWVMTKQGTVVVYAQQGSRPYMTLEFAYQGYCHLRERRGAVSKRYLITSARRFAEEIALQATEGGAS